MFDRVLIANRGEIACRVIATCQRLGIETVAVYSDADRRSRHVRLADHAVYLGPSPANRSYLDVDRVIAAAIESKSDAVHPGYGFLSENAGFALACAEKNIVFIGPGVDAIRLTGLKDASKAAMNAAGVPVVPGYLGDNQDDATLERAASDIGYPLMVKAVAGGGGKGMRVVASPDALTDALGAARREANAAFGDDRLILERYVNTPRHVEVQVLADTHGNYIHLHERDCSIQRRYQKIIEESPSPALDADARERITAAAVEAARAVGYTNAGTVEFIVDAGNNFYFMEMNARLQVEHPVTEMRFGLDLVEWQLRIAAGEELTLSQDELSPRGHAIEARIYAEDPARDYLPSVGRIDTLSLPKTGPHVRIDGGVDSGDSVSIFYDPMVAKLVVHDTNRMEAIDRLRQALNETFIAGIETNIGLLRRIAGDDAFRNGNVTTAFLDERGDALNSPAGQPPVPVIAGAVARILQERSRSGDSDPWSTLDGFRSAAPAHNPLRLVTEAGETTEATVVGSFRAFSLTVAGHSHEITASDSNIIVDGHREDVTALVSGRHILVVYDNIAWPLRSEPEYAVATVDSEDAHPGSPMPGRIAAISVSAGDEVTSGQTLLTIEGMKMEVAVRARLDGIVEAIHYAVGDMVEAEVPIVDIRPADSESGS